MWHLIAAGLFTAVFAGSFIMSVAYVRKGWYEFLDAMEKEKEQ